MPLGARYTLKKPPIYAPFGANDKDCPAVAFALVKHGSKPASGLDRADQTANFKVCGEPGVQKSGRVAVDRVGEQRVQRFGIDRFAQRGVHLFVAHHPADRGQRVQMRRARGFGRKQAEH